MPKKVVFLDTQIFLHYRPIEEIDWCSLLGADNVSVIIAPIVISELDKKKIDKDPKIKKRASRAIREISKLIESSETGTSAILRKDVELVFHPDEPAEFSDYRLDPNHPDDRLIATFLSYRKQHHLMECILISEDAGCRLKAHARKISLGRMPDSAKLQEEPDPNEQRIKELETELSQIKLSSPKLGIEIVGHGNKFEYNIHLNMERPADLLTIEEIRQRYPKQSTSSLYHPQSRASVSRSYISLSALNYFDVEKQKRIEMYDANLDKYFSAYASYFSKALANVLAIRHSIVLDLTIKNDGGAPAGEVKVILQFPGNVDVYRKSEPPNKPPVPVPPEKPDFSLAGRMTNVPFDYHPYPHERFASAAAFFPTHSLIPPVSEDLTIERGDETVVSYSTARLQHGFTQLIPALLILLRPNEFFPFQVTYQMHSSNLRVPIKGMLNIIIKQT